MSRYAIFFAPLASDPFTEAAARWLGRNPFGGTQVARPSLVEGLDLEQFDALTAEPRRYGFHGTLKAPFEMAEGRTIEELEQELEAYSKKLKPFALPKFKVGQLGRFFALLPSEPSEDLKELASGLVRSFDPFRAPLSEHDIARRNPDKLTPSQRENLLNWGYHYIFDDFRFHMTLTGQVPDELSTHFQAALDAHFAAVIETPQTVSVLSLYEEPERGAPFHVRAQYPMG